MATTTWVGITNKAFEKHVRKVEEDLARDRVLLAWLKDEGRFTYNNGGAGANQNSFDWRVFYKYAPMNIAVDASTRTFPRRDQYVIAKLPYIAYEANQSMTKAEKLACQGEEGIVKFLGQMGEKLTQGMTQQFSSKLYTDSSAAGNDDELSGFETWFGTTGNVSGDSGRVDQPNDTYANISTALGVAGLGSWSNSGTDWPAGTGDENYEFWSPVVVDTNDSVWGDTNGFASWGDDQIAYAAIMGSRFEPSGKGIQLFLMNQTDYFNFLKLARTKERITVDRGSKASKAVALGFNAITFDGYDIMKEYGVPANTVYGINPSQLELMSQQEKLFMPDGPEWDINTKGWKMSVDFYGNLRCKNPRSQVKLRP